MAFTRQVTVETYLEPSSILVSIEQNCGLMRMLNGTDFSDF